jgi:NADH-quinone oxidoreductase subunit L
MHTLEFPALYWIPLLPLLGAAFNLIVGRKLGRSPVHLVACGTVLGSLAVGLVATFQHLYPLWKLASHAGAGAAPTLTASLFDWITAGRVSIKLGLLFDPLAAVMVFVITFVGFLIHVYSTGYMREDPDYARFFGYLNLFTGSMLMLVLGDNLVTLFVGWEGVGVCSYLLIGFWYDKDGTRKVGDANATAGKKAFITNRVGDFAFVIGMLLIFSVTGTLSIGELAGSTGKLMHVFAPFGVKTVSVAALAGLLLLIGATGKSAQIPLYVWLPDAMAGPTPVSALIHAATMVTAGVYMIARLNFVFMLSPTLMGVVALVGAATAFYAATIGLAQNDIKKVLAYSTISQLGYMFLAVGVGAFSAGIFHLFTHAFFKACLFLGAGSVIHAMSGRQDIREMGGLWRKMPLTGKTFLVSCLAIAGIVPFSGFFSKDEILWRAISTANPGLWPSALPAVLYALALAGAACTAFYMFRLFFLTFWGPETRAGEETARHVHESPASMTMPLVVLAFGAAVVGLLGMPGVVEHKLQLPNLFHHWLAPVVDRGAQIAAGVPRIAPLGPNAYAQSSGLEVALALLSLAVAAAAIWAAWRWYRGGPSEQAERLAKRYPGLHRLVVDKYRIDELYGWLVVKPLRGLALVLWKAVDAFFIDLLGVNGSAAIVDVVGRISRRLHNGNVQRYVVALVTGVAAVVIWVGWPPDGFEIEPGRTVQLGQPVKFDASKNLAVEQRQLRYRWDFGDGSPPTGWSPTAVASHTYGKTGTFAVRLTVEDKRWRTSAKETHKVHVVRVADAVPAAAGPKAGVR